ncbi:hypothetical protein, partial [Campylobacter jejuni]
PSRIAFRGLLLIESLSQSRCGRVAPCHIAATWRGAHATRDERVRAGYGGTNRELMMLTALAIRNVVLIEALDLAFG